MSAEDTSRMAALTVAEEKQPAANNNVAVEPDRNKERRNALEARRRALMGRPQEPMDVDVAASTAKTKADPVYLQWAARPYPRQLVLGADKAHPLHVLFSCYEKALARPPREQPRKVGFPCQLEQNPEKRLLRSVVRDLPHAVGKIRFDNVYHLAQLIAITLEGNVPEKELLFRCAKRAAVVTTDTLSIALVDDL